jgi:hypothetical protein
MSEDEILTEIRDLKSNGIHYLANDNIASLCNFTFNKDIKGDILVPKEDTNDISEFILVGVFEIDARNFFMTSDGKWSSNNPLGTRFDQVKPSCRLLPAHRENDFSSFQNDFQTFIANIRAIENLGNPRKSRDVHSIIIEENGQTQIKLFHHLFFVSQCSFLRTIF